MMFSSVSSYHVPPSSPVASFSYTRPSLLPMPLADHLEQGQVVWEIVSDEHGDNFFCGEAFRPMPMHAPVYAMKMVGKRKSTDQHSQQQQQQRDIDSISTQLMTELWFENKNSDWKNRKSDTETDEGWPWEEAEQRLREAMKDDDDEESHSHHLAVSDDEEEEHDHDGLSCNSGDTEIRKKAKIGHKHTNAVQRVSTNDLQKMLDKYEKELPVFIPVGEVTELV